MNRMSLKAVDRVFWITGIVVTVAFFLLVPPDGWLAVLAIMAIGWPLGILNYRRLRKDLRDGGLSRRGTMTVMEKAGGDLFWCVCMILATPVCILLALNTDALAVRAANPRAAQAVQAIRYGGWLLSAVCPVMAVLLWRSWRKSRVNPPASNPDAPSDAPRGEP